jgi:DNA invertase Pin-like site-specific DNA recombinase
VVCFKCQLTASRNPFEFQKLLEEFSFLQITIHIQTLGLKALDENGNRNPFTDMTIGILSQFSKMEREHLIQRVRSGLSNARKNGKVLGRPKGSTLDNRSLIKKYHRLTSDLKAKISMRKISKFHEVSLVTILKVKKALVS